MPIIRKATLGDIDELVKLRIELIREISEVDENYMAKLADAIREYFTAKMPENEFLGWVAEDEGKIIASSGLLFHEKPPIHGNLTGREAYIMNMYTLPEWRNKGIATKLLNLLRKQTCDAFASMLPRLVRRSMKRWGLFWSHQK